MSPFSFDSFQVFANCRKIMIEFSRMVLSCLSDFFNDGIFHVSLL